MKIEKSIKSFLCLAALHILNTEIVFVLRELETKFSHYEFYLIGLGVFMNKPR